MANSGRKVYQFLVQVNATTGVPTGLRKSNDPADPDYAAPVIDYTKCPVSAWQAIDPACETQPVCQPGWSLSPDGSTCSQTQTAGATPPSGNGGSPGTAGKVNNVAWGDGGALVFANGFNADGSGSSPVSLLKPHLWVNGNFAWDSAGRNTTDGRMNFAGIWVAGHEVDGAPFGEFIGFSRKVTVLFAKTVLVGIAGDNRVKIVVNGIQLIDMTNQNGAPNFSYWNIYPVNLQAGDNYIELYGLNAGGAAGFATEIYDMTVAQLQAANSPSDLTLLFTTGSVVGEPFDLGQTIGWSCAPGWSLDTSQEGPGNPPVCKKTATTTPSLQNTGLKSFANRRRITNTVPDGYVEPNTQTGGLGPYFSPVQDLINCPVPAPPSLPNPPVVTLSPDQTIQLPTSSVTVTGAVQTSAPSYGVQWTQASGPNAATILSPTSLSTTVTGLIQGTYVFRMVATDSFSQTGSAQTTIVVNAAPAPQPGTVKVQNSFSTANITAVVGLTGLSPNFSLIGGVGTYNGTHNVAYNSVVVSVQRSGSVPSGSTFHCRLQVAGIEIGSIQADSTTNYVFPAFSCLESDSIVITLST